MGDDKNNNKQDGFLIQRDQVFKYIFPNFLKNSNFKNYNFNNLFFIVIF